ncbi:MAG: discoidin domain-containing protein [Phycisphaerae bacterium]|nr:discoidin domain-containing protein [Phycisphaerae bacterium]
MLRRKFQITLLLVLGLLAGNTLAQSLVQIDPGSVSDGHVYLLEDASDASPAGNTGNIIGAPQVVDGLSGMAMQFNGTSDGVHIPDSAFINTAVHQNLTVIAVFNCADVTKTEKQVVFEEGGTTRGLNIYVHEGLAYAGGWNPADYTPQWTGTFISAPIGSNEWHVVAAVVRGGGAGQEDDKFEMWMDGQLIGKGPGAQLNARSDDNGIAHVIGQSKAHDGNITGGGSFFGGLIDEVWILDHALTESELAAIAPNKTGAKNPVPANDGEDVLRDSELSWTPGAYAVKHHVYFGDSFEDVNAGTTPLAVLDVNTYDPGRMAFGKAYYWRVDEVNGAPDNTVFKGEVWNFTAEPYSIMIPVDVNRVTASSFIALNPTSMIVNGSGLVGNAHGTDSDTMWLSASPDLDPWLMVEFENIEKLDQMLIWNSNSSSEGFIGWGMKDAKIEYSVDGENWTTLAESTPIDRAPGQPTYSEPQAIDFGSVPAKFVKISILGNWGGILQQHGVAELQFYGVPVFARTPIPVDGAANIRPDAIATWRAGREAGQHSISLSQDPNAIVDGSAASVSTNTNSVDLISFDPEMGATYYWRVDEVNETEDPSLWAGPVWSFSTVDSLVVEDFESYGNLSPDRPFQAWYDGYGYSADEYFPVDYPGNGTGSGVGHDIWGPGSPYFGGSIMETTIVYGGSQSMPLYYDNTGGAASETQRTFDMPQNWTVGGIQSLSLMVHGTVGNTGQLYAKINSAKITGAPDISQAGWQAWIIDLSTVAGNLQNVTSLTIGVEGAGAEGMLYIDEIRLYSKPGELVVPTEPGTNGLVAYFSFDENSGATAADGSGNNNYGDVVGGAQWVAGKVGGALAFDGVDDMVVVTQNSGLPIYNNGTDNAYSVAMWVKGGPQNDMRVFSEASTTTNNPLLNLGTHNSATPTGQFAGYIRPDAGTTLNHPLSQAQPFDDTWHHIAWVDDNGTARLYIDGLLDGGDFNYTRGTMALDTTTIGGILRAAPSHWFTGQIDEVRIYSRALSAGEALGLAGKTQSIYKPFE